MITNKGIVRLAIYPNKEIRTAARQDRKGEASETSGNIASIEYSPPPANRLTKSNKDLSLELNLKEAINATRSSDNALLVIDSNNYLEHFKENIFLDYLRLIDEANIDFKIIGLEGLTKENISLFIKIFEQKKKNQSKALFAEPVKNKKRKNSAGVTALTSKENLKHNKLKKRQISDLDPNNIRARKLIQELKEKQKLSDYRISKELNERGVLTSQNSQFQANTVKRQYEAIKELEKKFYENEAYKSLKDLEGQFHINEEMEETAFEAASLDMHKESVSHDIREIPLDFEYEAALNDKLILNFKNPLEREIFVAVHNNRNENIFSFNVEKGEKSIILDLLNDTPIGPGRYYAKLFENQASGQPVYESMWITFIVRKDVLSSDAPLVNVISASDFR